MPAYTIDDLRSTLHAVGRESDLPADLVIRATERGVQLRHRRAAQRNSAIALIITALVVTAGLTLVDANGEALPPPAVPNTTTAPAQESDLQQGDVVLVIAGPEGQVQRQDRVDELRQGGFDARVADADRFRRVPFELQRVVVIPLTATTVEEGIAMCESVRSRVGLSACDSSSVQQVIGGPVPRCEQQTLHWPEFGWRRCD